MCKCWSEFVRWLPPFLIIILSLYAIYALTIELCIFILPFGAKQIVYLTLAIIIFSLFTWSFMHCILLRDDNREIPSQFKISINEHNRLMTLTDDEQSNILEKYAASEELPLWTRTSSGRIRYCKKCFQIKPDRTHHCSTCGHCVLRMDHHCPWINNCVGFYNYKSFVLMNIYATLCTILSLISILETYISSLYTSTLFQLNIHGVLVLIGGVVSLMLGVLCAALYFSHVQMILTNETTIEGMQDIKFVQDVTFDLGKQDNLIDLLGENVCFWFLPIHSAFGDGVNYEVRYARSSV